jgi:glutathione S-transferase
MPLLQIWGRSNSDWSNTVLWPLLRPLFLGIVRTAPEQRDPKALEDARSRTAQALAIADACLETRAYIAGDEWSMGDIPLGCVLWRWMAMPIGRPILSNLQRWFESLACRPAPAKVVMLPLR